jgi:ribosomal protein S18 acetylase RimI-like enzyme
MEGAMDAPERVDVQAATEAAFEELADLQWQWRVEERHDASAFDHDEFVDALRIWMESHGESHQAFVARAGTRPVGMGWLAVVERVPTPTQFRRLGGHIQSVYVVPSLRDHGIGSALMERLIQRARNLGLAWLLVHPSGRSFGFYRRHGFIPTGRFLELRLAGP